VVERDASHGRLAMAFRARVLECAPTLLFRNNNLRVDQDDSSNPGPTTANSGLNISSSLRALFG
jgi:hypothetical protein